MNPHLIYSATINAGGQVDMECRPSALNMDGYATILGNMVQATVNMFVAAGVPEKEALDTILKRLNREARNKSPGATFSSTQMQ